MGTLLVFAASNALTMLLTAWLLHRHSTGQSPLPTLPAKSETTNGEIEADQYHAKGRPVL